MEKTIDILEHLSKIVQENTQHYQSDFTYDQETLRQAAQAYDADNRTFYWMSRPNGTWCVKEREVFIKGSGAHSIWTQYVSELEQSSAIKAYRIVVTGLENGKVMGTIRGMNYKEQVQRVLANSVPATAITLIYESGLVDTVSLDKYPRSIPTVRPKDGAIKDVRYEVADNMELDRIIMAENREQTKKPSTKRPRHRGR